VILTLPSFIPLSYVKTNNAVLAVSTARHVISRLLNKISTGPCLKEVRAPSIT
jgi:hypothetical protein